MFQAILTDRTSQRPFGRQVDRCDLFLKHNPFHSALARESQTNFGVRWETQSVMPFWREKDDLVPLVSQALRHFAESLNDAVNLRVPSVCRDHQSHGSFP